MSFTEDDYVGRTRVSPQVLNDDPRKDPLEMEKNHPELCLTVFFLHCLFASLSLNLRTGNTARNNRGSLLLL